MGSSHLKKLTQGIRFAFSVKELDNKFDFTSPASSIAAAAIGSIDKSPRSIMVSQMPRKIRQLVSDLEHAGFIQVPTKSSHRKYRYSDGATVILSGQSGEDAHHYQEKEVRRAIAATTKENK